MNVLEAKDLSFAYGNTPVLDAASFTMCEGGFAALVGVNGAGKSTLLRLLLGELKPTGGHIALMGQDIGSFKSWQRIGYVPQDGLTRKESFPASVNEVVLANLYSRIGLFRFPRREHRGDVRRTLELVGMQDYGCRMLGELSGGQRQRVCIARALAMNPEIIIADESVSALDVSVRAQIINLLLALQKEFRIAFLFISHDMAVIERVCHRVAVMYLGQIVELGSRRDVFENPLHPYTKRLMSAVPIPDPSRRTMSHTLLTGEIPSPVRSADYEPVVAPLKEVSPGHFVSEEQVANWF